jgi:hypothetical protein
MADTDDYDKLFRHQDGHLRAPFSHVGYYLTIQGVSPSAAERRAIENATQFLVSLAIFAERLRSHLGKYRPDSWVDVPLFELFLDTQSLFLFVQQYLEDIALIIRMSLPYSQRHQMPAAFRHLVPRLRQQVLSEGHPLRRFLDREWSWFEELSGVRDDICHRTAYQKVRARTFPGLHDLLRAGGGATEFLSASDLRAYVRDLFRRIMALSCLVEAFVYTGILQQHPRGSEVPPGYVVAAGEVDLTAQPTEQFPFGTVFMIFERASLENIEFFLSREEGEPPNLVLESAEPA